MPATTSVYRARLRWQLVAGLRRWALGAPSDQAAVELLVRCFSGRFVRPGVAWVRPCARPGWYWLDGDALAAYADTVTGEERRVLTLAAVLLGADPVAGPEINSGRAVA
jgi:hypothetical protein